MLRLVLALAFVLLAVPVDAQEIKLRADLSILGLGPISGVNPVEADGKRGAEWLVGRGVFVTEWFIVYPWSARSGLHGETDTPGLCIAGPFAIGMYDRVADIDGDGVDELVALDTASQTVTARAFPADRCKG